MALLSTRKKFKFSSNPSPFKGKILLYFLCLLALFLLCSCSPKESSKSSPDYNQTKELVLDILHTDEGKKAVQEVMGNEEAKKQMILEAPEVRKVVQETLLSEENKQKLEELMSDPEFVKEYAKQLEEQHKHLIKALMKDPEYQTAMQEILKDPEMEKHILELTKSKEFRQQTMAVMKEAIQSPYFRLELLQLMSKVAEEGLGQEKKGGEGGGGDSGGDGGGGGS